MMEVGSSWWGRPFWGFVWGRGASVLCEGQFFCWGCGSLCVGCQLFAGLTKVIAWGRLSTV